MERRKGRVSCLGIPLQPAVALEDEVECQGDQQHERQRERVPKKPVQLRYMIEVHPINRSYERRSEEDCCPGADLLYLFVLILDLLVLGQAHQGEVHVENVLQKLAEAIDLLHDVQD